MTEKERSRLGTCLCCGGAIKRQTTLVSAFLAERAWGGGAEWSDTSRCVACGFAFHGRGLNNQEVARYYKDYRDEDYFRRRHAHEPFYTRAVHDGIETALGAMERREALVTYLAGNGVSPRSDWRILDYAGGTGRLISEFVGERFVFDVSGEVSHADVTTIDSGQLTPDSFDLVVCAQMIEHATWPRSVAEDLLKLVKPGGYLYFEVPFDETWRDYAMAGPLRDMLLSLALKCPKFNILLDAYGTAFRVKLGFLPPLAYVPVREHLNYFTPRSFRKLGERIGAKVLDASRIPLLGTTLLLQKI